MSYAQNRRSFESTTSYATLWTNTDWINVQKYVDKQQRRIYRAESNNDKRKVRDLQRMLVRSSAALKLAIRRWNMIKHNYSPYDATKSEYFINRSRKQFSRR